MTEKEIIKKGFNAGYQLAKHKPELANQLKEGFKDKQSPYPKAFIAGTNEYAKEMNQSKQTGAWKPRNIVPRNDAKSQDKDKGFSL